MGKISLQADSVQEACQLLREIAPNAESKGARRLAVFRKLRGQMTFNRIAQIDRRSERVVVTADEVKVLREAARGKSDDLKTLVERLQSLERDLGELRQFRDYASRALAQMAERGVGGRGGLAERPELVGGGTLAGTQPLDLVAAKGRR